MQTRVALALVIALAVAGCARSYEDPNNSLSKVLLDKVSPAYEPVKGPASGPMDLESAANSTPADTSLKRRLLRRSGYQDGYSRAWTKGGDYITALAHEFASEKGATALTDFEIEQVEGKRGTTLFSVPEIPGGRGYILSGVKRKGLKAIFCQGVWFISGARAFSVTTCSPQPNSAESARALALKQHKKAA